MNLRAPDLFFCNEATSLSFCESFCRKIFFIAFDFNSNFLINATSWLYSIDHNGGYQILVACFLPAGLHVNFMKPKLAKEVVNEEADYEATDEIELVCKGKTTINVDAEIKHVDFFDVDLHMYQAPMGIFAPIAPATPTMLKISPAL
jgi:hypothetical protein